MAAGAPRGAGGTGGRELPHAVRRGARRLDNNAYWKQWEGPVRETGEKVYTTFLQGYGQTLGMRSYGACVDLLVEEFLPNTISSD